MRQQNKEDWYTVKKGMKYGYCIYRHVYFLGFLLFKPTMCGRLLFKYPFRMKAPFSMRKDKKCYWYFVLMDNYMIVLYPETCIEDIQESTLITDWSLNKLGEAKTKHEKETKKYYLDSKEHRKQYLKKQGIALLDNLESGINSIGVN